MFVRKFVVYDWYGNPYKMTAKELIVETPFRNLSVIPTNTSLSSAEFDLFEFDETETG